MKTIHILKQLAESNHIFGTPLTKEQIRLIRKTKYASLLREDVDKGKFERLLENTLSGESTEEKTPKDKKKQFLYLGIQREQIASLAHELEDMFNLGLDNKSSKKYREVDIDKFKDRIKKFIIKNDNKLNNPTKHTIREAIYDMNSVSGIMSKFYHYCAS
jgi:hypothetical protein